MDTETYRNNIDTLCKVGLIEVEAGKNTVFIVNWLAHNGPANPKHAIGMITQLKSASSDKLFCKRFEELIQIIKTKKFDKEQAVRAIIETVSQRYQNGIATETRPETRDQDGDQTRPRPNLDLREITQTALRSAFANGQSGLAPSRGLEPNPRVMIKSKKADMRTNDPHGTFPKPTHQGEAA
jgi:hypothetical protein